ncbi:OmpA family protein [Fulvivirgaceae bacterium BMA12]|uniref:OmpA family protein n=1 Tax=Agaribacillus aureus TaxID=3051825 RepID=A0ABT8L910_9BACT|nr:OmpA family protein [Fulvivirgaceae bacterium BMA12]
MLIDYKMFLWCLCLCWLLPSSSEAVATDGFKVNGMVSGIIATDPAPEYVKNTNAIATRYYVVIGAYREMKNANQLIRRVTSVGFEPKYFWNRERRLYYVYIVIYNDAKAAYRVSSKLREVNFIKDAWVFSAEGNEPLSEGLIANASVKNQNLQLIGDPRRGRPKDEVRRPRPAEKPASSEPKKEVKTTLPPADKTTAKENVEEPAGKDNNQVLAQTPKKPKEQVKAASFRTTSSKAINQLVKASKGDIIIFDDLLFHKNSSVLRKVSKDEMERLQEVLNANKNLRIKIHGHTNGDFKGEIYLLAENDDRFFKLSGKNKVVKGGDKLLSAERAKVIKRYLGVHGIDAGRIETQGWGDNKMLYPKGHLKAPLNRRVEIEVLQE